MGGLWEATRENNGSIPDGVGREALSKLLAEIHLRFWISRSGGFGKPLHGSELCYRCEEKERRDKLPLHGNITGLKTGHYIGNEEPEGHDVLFPYGKKTDANEKTTGGR